MKTTQKTDFFLAFCVCFYVCLCVCVSVRAFVIEVFLVHHGVRKIPLLQCIPLGISTRLIPNLSNSHPINAPKQIPCNCMRRHRTLISGFWSQILDTGGFHGCTGFTGFCSFTRLYRISLKILKSTIFIADQCRICNFYGDYGFLRLCHLVQLRTLVQ